MDAPDVIPPDFDATYTDDPDPWRVATSWYEQRKIDVVLATLRRRSYRLVWDAACGTGELAARLAQRSETVWATDASARAVELTRRRIAEVGADNVVIGHSALPGPPDVVSRHAEPGRHGRTGDPAVPGPDPDVPAPELILLSEVLYYLDEEHRLATYRMVESLAGPATDIVAVHWRPHPEDAYRSGEAVQRELNDHLIDAGWCRVITHTDLEFVLACWSRDVPQTLGR